jgi:hypothetical protein
LYSSPNGSRRRKNAGFCKNDFVGGLKELRHISPLGSPTTPAAVDDYRQRSHREVATLLTMYSIGEVLATAWKCPEMEFLDINLTKDSSLLFLSIHSPF